MILKIYPPSAIRATDMLPSPPGKHDRQLIKPRQDEIF